MDRLEKLIARDPGGRGVAALQVPGDLERAARSLGEAHRLLIVTGFAVGPHLVAETDGPPGALFLGRGLERLGKRIAFATHRSCEPVMQAGLRALGLDAPLEVLDHDGGLPDPIIQRQRPDLVVAIELPGRAADGQYYSMRGTPITPRTSALDGLLLVAACQGIRTIGVGDGGNEAGMGKVAEQVRRVIPRGDLIASVIPADYLVAAGTSNWGCYGMLAALDPGLLPTPSEEMALLTTLIAAGALDGVRLEAAATVDGLESGEYLQMLEALKGEG
jgi:hypothetical protein